MPARLTGLAVARALGGLATVGAVYAVAGDEAVYRFSVDGLADQRIAAGAGAGSSTTVEAGPVPSGHRP